MSGTVKATAQAGRSFHAGAVRRRAWWLLVAVGILMVLFGVTDIISGVAADPGITLSLSGMTLAEIQAADPVAYRLYDFATRTNGASLIVMGVLLTLVLLVPYRAGERWAWLVTWILPIWSFSVPLSYLAAGVDPAQPPAPPMVSGPIIGALAVVVLLLDRRRFVDRSRRRRPVAGTVAGSL
jgi:hypothetical protein